MIVQPVTYDAALYVALRMRALDAEEIFACRWRDEPEDVARAAAGRGPLAWAVGADGEPIACIGVFEVWPGLWESWMFATDKFDMIGKPLTRFARRVIIPALKTARARRVQCHSMEGHTVAHRWLESFGAVHEHTIRRFGRDGQDFRLYHLPIEDDAACA